MKKYKDPLELVAKILEVMGALPPIEGQTTWFYWSMVVFKHLMYVCGYLTTTIFLYEEHPFLKKMESMQCFISLFHMFGKYVNLHYRQKPYRRLVATARRMWDQAHLRPENEQLLQKISKDTQRSIALLMVMFAGAVPCSCLMTTINNIFINSGERDTLYQVWDPVPDESWFWTSCLFEGFTMGILLICLSASLATMYAHCLLAAGHMTILRDMLEAEQVDIKASVRLHQNILRYVKDINEYFSAQMFLEVVVSALQNSVRSYMCIKMISDGDAKGISAGFILLLCMIGPFVVCLSGHVITSTCEKLFRSVYQNRWYNMKTSDRRSLALMMCQANKTIILNYRNLLTFDMERYSTVMQATYSYITILAGADI